MTSSLTAREQALFDWLVRYRDEHRQELSPSIREMVDAMGLKSPSGIQHRLKSLHKKGYIDWAREENDNRHRTRIRILKEPFRLPLVGAIAAGDLIDPFTDIVEYLDLSVISEQPQHFALRVVGDSMVGDFIIAGDIAVMRRVDDPENTSNGDIVAAQVAGSGTTLKRFYRQGNTIRLEPSNPAYEPIEIDADELQLQGVLVGIWRNVP